MTYAEVRATGAEVLLYAFVELPNDGWQEVSIGTLRKLNEEATKEVQRATSAKQHQTAVAIQESSSIAIQRAESGNRVFTVAWNGDRAFAATNKPSASLA